MGLRDQLRRLRRDAREELIEVRQPDGTIKRFQSSDGVDALIALIDGRDHPLAEAVRVSPDPEWQSSFYNAFPIPDDAEDLSS
jgi:hypothetical protein